MTSLHHLHRPGGLSLQFASLGATWLSCRVPLADGSVREALLGNDPARLPQRLRAYMGATIGRYANRIGGARIGGSIALTPNPGSRHQLHGGPGGFHAHEWSVQPLGEDALRFTHVSPAGDQGYPGEARAEVTYRLVDAMTLEMEAAVTVSERCPVCITNHAYFNLDGGGDVRDHRLRIAADRYLPVDGDLIPLGPLAPVSGTGFDFRQAKPLRQDWLRDAQQQPSGGYDHAFLLDPRCADGHTPAVELQSRDARLRMVLSTTLPAVQLYGGQFLHEVEAGSGETLPSCGGLALEPQFLPDSPNHPEWPQPSCWVDAGGTYRQWIRYRFEG